MKLKKYLRELLELRLSVKEKRRQLDYDHKNREKELLNNDSTQGRIELIEFRHFVKSEENLYEEKLNQIKTLEEIIFPEIEPISPTNNDPIKIHIKDSTYFDAYLENNKEIITTDYYTQT